MPDCAAQRRPKLEPRHTIDPQLFPPDTTLRKRCNSASRTVVATISEQNYRFFVMLTGGVLCLLVQSP
jgi:hypothetical protein